MKSLFALNPYFWKYKKYLFWGLFTVVASNLFSIYPAQFLRSALDWATDLLKINPLLEGFEAQNAWSDFIGNGILFFSGGMIVISIVSGVFLFFNRQTLIYMSRLIEYDLRNDLYAHFQSLSLAFYRKNKVGDLMTRLTEDVNRVRMYLGPALMYTFNTLVRFILVISAMFVISPKLSIFSLLPLPVLSVMIYIVQSVIEKRRKKIQEQLSILNTYSQEIFSGIRVVKAYAKENEIRKKFEEETETYKERSMYATKVDALFYPSVTLLVGLSSVFTIWIGSEEVIQGNVTIGNIAEFVLYIGMLAWPIISLGWVTTLVQQAAVSQGRLNDLMKVHSEVIFPETPTRSIQTAHIEWDDVSFTYPDTGILGLKNVSFQLKAGQKLGVVGAAGSGKTTLCQLMLRMYNPDSGEIRIENTPLPLLTQSQLRNFIGYAPQDVFLFSDTLQNNIAFGKPDATQQEIEQAAKDAAVYENIVNFPEGFETIIGERGVNLSGGQKQRISLARARIRNPQLLILDDVLSAVDTETEDTILRNLKLYRQANPTTSVIQVAHRLSCIQDADLILVLEDGQVVETGTHEELIQQKGYYNRIYDLQLAEQVETTR